MANEPLTFTIPDFNIQKSYKVSWSGSLTDGKAIISQAPSSNPVRKTVNITGIPAGATNIKGSMSVTLGESDVSVSTIDGTKAKRNQTNTISIPITGNGARNIDFVFVPQTYTTGLNPPTVTEKTKYVIMTYSNIVLTVTYDLTVNDTISSAAEVTRGNALTVNFLPATSTFAHCFAIKHKGSDPNIYDAWIDTGTNSHTVPAAFITQNMAPGEYTMWLGTCTTFRDISSIIGNWATKDITVKPSTAEITPTITQQLTATITPNALTNAGWNFFLQGKSTAKLTFAASKGTYSDGFTKTVFTLGSQRKEYTEGWGTWTSGVITESGTVHCTVQIWNKEGLSCTSPCDINVVPYYKPRINNLTAFRALANGNADSNGTYANVSCSIDYASVNGLNTTALTHIYWRKFVNNAWSGWTELTNDTDHSFIVRRTVASINLPGISGASNIPMQIYAHTGDVASGADSAPVTLSTSDVVMYFKDGGRNVCVGTKSDTENALVLNPDWKFMHGTTDVLGTMNTNFANMNSTFAAISNNNTAIANRFASNETNISTVTSKVATLEPKVSTLENKMNCLYPGTNYIAGTVVPGVSTTLNNTWRNIFQLTINETGMYMVFFTGVLPIAKGKSAIFATSGCFINSKQTVYINNTNSAYATGVSPLLVYQGQTPKTIYLTAYSSDGAEFDPNTTIFGALKIHGFDA